MAEDITQDLGFDASKALDALDKLGTKLKSFEQGLSNAASMMEGFNKKGGKTVSALVQIKENARLAADQLDRVLRAQNRLNGGGGGKGPTPAAPTNANQIAKDLEKYFEVPKNATDEQARAIKSNIVQMSEYAAKNKISTNEVIDAHKNMGKMHTGVMNKMADMTAKTHRAVSRAFRGMSADGGHFTVTWETMSRVVMTQAIVRALSSFRNAVEQSIASAVKFEKQVAQIRTITAEKDLGRLKDSIRGISDEFNIPLSETGAAYYETISNQIGNSIGEYEKFTATVAKFSKITSTTMDEAGKLIAGTIHAFGKDVSEAEDVAAKFFRTIDLGAATGEELANVYGMVAPMAAKLGVSMEELDAAFATITINGVSAAKAGTQLRGILNALMKPTKEMDRVLKTLGFSSPEQLMAAYDLGEAVNLLASQTDGTARAIAKLFPEVRGLTGQLILVGDQGRQFAQVLRDINDTSENLYDRELKLMFSTNAEQVTKELNKLKNFLTLEFGQGILDSYAAMTKWVGGTESIIRVLKAMGDTAPWAATAITALAGVWASAAASAQLANKEATALNKTLGAISLFLLAHTAGGIIGKAIDDWMSAEGKASQEWAKRHVETYQKAIKSTLKIEEQRAAEIDKLQERELAKKRVKYLKDVDNYQAAAKEKLKQAEKAADRIVKAWESAIDDMAQKSKRLRDMIAENNFASDSRATALEDKLFRRSIDHLSDKLKYQKAFEKAQQLATRGAWELARAGSAADPQKAAEAARSYFDRAEAYHDIAYDAAKELANVEKIREANRQLQDIYRKRQWAEDDLNKSLAERSRKLEEDRYSALGQLDHLQEMVKRYKELLSTTDEAGKILLPSELARNQAEAAKLAKEIAKTALGGTLDLKDFFDPTGFRKMMEEEVSLVDLKKLAVGSTALGDLKAQIQTALDEFKPELTIKAKVELEAIYGKSIETPEQYAEAVAIKNDLRKATNATTLNLATLEKTAEAQRLAAETALKGFVGSVPREPKRSVEFNAMAMMPTIREPSKAQMDAYQNDLKRIKAKQDMEAEIRKVTQAEAVTEAELASILVKSEQLRKNWKLNAFEVQKLADALNAMLERLKVQEQIKQESGLDAAGMDLNLLKSENAKRDQLLRSYDEKASEQLQPMEGAAKAAADSQASLNAAVAPLAQMAGYGRSLADDLSAAADAAWAIGLSRGMMTSAFGGPAYLAAGGRGIDKVPAMLAAGEVVMNQRASRNFFTQLQAMNAGMRPVYRDAGGEITSIGDVSITVNESSSPRATAREVMNAFRREQRRRTGRI